MLRLRQRINRRLFQCPERRTLPNVLGARAKSREKDRIKNRPCGIGRAGQKHTVMISAVIKEIKRDIKERVIELDTEEYIAFMRELSEWAQTEADIADFSADDQYSEND